jgi:hypothetical protein
VIPKIYGETMEEKLQLRVTTEMYNQLRAEATDRGFESLAPYIRSILERRSEMNQ